MYLMPLNCTLRIHLLLQFSPFCLHCSDSGLLRLTKYPTTSEYLYLLFCPSGVYFPPKFPQGKLNHHLQVFSLTTLCIIKQHFLPLVSIPHILFYNSILDVTYPPVTYILLGFLFNGCPFIRIYVPLKQNGMKAPVTSLLLSKMLGTWKVLSKYLVNGLIINDYPLILFLKT